MKVIDVVEKLNLKVCSGEAGLANEVSGGYVSDLLSDVMGNSSAGMIWVTVQNHKNVMAVAGLKDLAAVILVEGEEPANDTIEQSNRELIPILSTDMDTFSIAGRLYCLLNRPS